MNAPWQDHHRVLAGHPAAEKFGQDAERLRAKHSREMSKAYEQAAKLSSADGAELVRKLAVQHQNELSLERTRQSEWLDEHAVELLALLRKADDRLCAEVRAHCDGGRTTYGLTALVEEAGRLSSTFATLAYRLRIPPRDPHRFGIVDEAQLVREVVAGARVLPSPVQPAPDRFAEVQDLSPRQARL